MMLKYICISSLILLLCVGCGERRTYSKTEMVEGIVTLDGDPIEGAEIVFFPIDSGEGATGKTDSAGRYTLSSVKGAPGKGVPAGEYGITVSKRVVTELPEPVFNPADDSFERFKIEEKIPSAYREIHDTPLKGTVVSGNNTINLELDSKAK